MKDSLSLPAAWKKVIVLFLLVASMLAAQPLCTKPVCAAPAPQAQVQA
ncbi:MAG: hypothetical protein LKJ90_01020 [Faecalibacterium sp.]|jgi:hypothetical protein|nr:hypothetical protein [Faecalibacterium sp.]